MKIYRYNCRECGRELVTTHELGRGLCEYCEAKKDNFGLCIVMGLVLMTILIVSTL